MNRRIFTKLEEKYIPVPQGWMDKLRHENPRTPNSEEFNVAIGRVRDILLGGTSSAAWRELQAILHDAQLDEAERSVAQDYVKESFKDKNSEWYEFNALIAMSIEAIRDPAQAISIFHEGFVDLYGRTSQIGWNLDQDQEEDGWWGYNLNPEHQRYHPSSRASVGHFFIDPWHGLMQGDWAPLIIEPYFFEDGNGFVRFHFRLSEIELQDYLNMTIVDVNPATSSLPYLESGEVWLDTFAQRVISLRRAAENRTTHLGWLYRHFNDFWYPVNFTDADMSVFWSNHGGGGDPVVSFLNRQMDTVQAGPGGAWQDQTVNATKEEIRRLRQISESLIKYGDVRELVSGVTYIDVARAMLEQLRMNVR